MLTADTYGSVYEQCEADFLNIRVIGKEKQDEQKLSFVESLDADIMIGSIIDALLISNHLRVALRN